MAEKAVEKRILVAGAEFATQHRGKRFHGKPGDGQVFDPHDFYPKRLEALLASGALRWQTITLKTVKPSETKADKPIGELSNG